MTHTQKLAKIIRLKCLLMVHKAKASHIGGCLSITDILAVLYGDILKYKAKQPNWDKRDRVVYSKGHAAAALYATLSECGFITTKSLESYCQPNSNLIGHCSQLVPGVEVGTGSLGHGLSIACGMALAAKSQKKPYRVFSLLSDGEIDEGSTLEAMLFAPHHKLDNLITIVDYNKIQSFGSVKEVLDLKPLAKKWQSFNWAVQEIDGHDHKALIKYLKKSPLRKGKPTVLIAHTVKGKGISFMENKLEWHYKSPNEAQLLKAIAELERA
ncbi:transketolase [bacterium K02(2017)]|nr:transketolase [bacterium K02(2017)]